MFFEVEPLNQPVFAGTSGKQIKKAVPARRLFAAWIVLSVIALGLGYLLYGFILMSHGDINRDGVVDARDSAIISTRSTDTASDLNGDGKVDSEDLKILAQHWTDRTILEKETPKASIATPPKVISKPIIYEQ